MNILTDLWPEDFMMTVGLFPALRKLDIATCLKSLNIKSSNLGPDTPNSKPSETPTHHLLNTSSDFVYKSEG